MGFLRDQLRLSGDYTAVTTEDTGALPDADWNKLPVIDKPSRRMTDLPIGAIALVVSGPERAREAIENSFPEAPPAGAVDTALGNLIATFGPHDHPYNGGEAA